MARKGVGGSRGGARRQLSKAEVRTQHATELPEREAMSLILPSTGGLPMVGDAAGAGATPTGPATSYVSGVQDPALDQTANATEIAGSSSSSGQNAPNGTATASSAT